MYNLTRQEAADLLKMSIRNIDRYIKSGKIRHKKE
jgi:predicted site-specific integrase-resolvase